MKKVNKENYFTALENYEGLINKHFEEYCGKLDNADETHFHNAIETVMKSIDMIGEHDEIEYDIWGRPMKKRKLSLDQKIEEYVINKNATTLPTERVKYRLPLSIGYYIQSKEYYKNKDVNYIHALNLAFKTYDEYINSSQKSDAIKIGKFSHLGGKSKAKKVLPIKELIVKLLLERVPTDRWKNKKDAIDAIIEDVKNAITESRELTQTNLRRKIEDWSRNDFQIRDTFIKVIIQKPSLILKQ